MQQPISTQEQLTAITDRLALRGLVDEYALAVDARDAALLVQLFTDDGEIAGYQNDDTEPGMLHVGRDSLMTVFDGLLDGFAATLHVMGNHTCSIDRDRATGVVYALTHHLGAEADERGHLTDELRLIRYDDHYRRVDGRWLFARRAVRLQWFDVLDARRRWR